MKKDDNLLVKINKEEKKAFIKMCKEEDTSASREVRRFIKDYIKEHGAVAQLGERLVCIQ